MKTLTEFIAKKHQEHVKIDVNSSKSILDVCWTFINNKVAKGIYKKVNNYVQTPSKRYAVLDTPNFGTVLAGWFIVAMIGHLNTPTSEEDLKSQVQTAMDTLGKKDKFYIHMVDGDKCIDALEDMGVLEFHPQVEIDINKL